eukprot:gene9272-19247_t
MKLQNKRSNPRHENLNSDIVNVSFKCSFSFEKENIRQILIDDTVFMRLERVDPAVARLHFVDAEAVEVDIPEGIIVHDNTNNIQTQPTFLGAQFFVLCWSDNYTITLNGETVLDLSNQRLRVPVERQVETIRARF